MCSLSIWSAAPNCRRVRRRARAFSWIGSPRTGKGRWRPMPSARPLFERALAISEKALGPEHPTTAASLNNLGNLLRYQGDLAGARPLYERAVAIDEKVYGSEHPEVATDLNNLAVLLWAHGDLASARRSASGRRRSARRRSPEHPDTANSLSGLGLLLQDQQDLPGAQRRLNRALAIREKALGPEYPNTNLTRGNLASVRLAQGAPSEALAMSETALGRSKRRSAPITNRRRLSPSM